MRLTHPSWLHSLGFKIGIAIILIEAVILAWTGTLYIHNFNQEIDARIRESLLLPATLMNKGILNFNAVTDRVQMKQLMGEDLQEAFIVGINGNIFLSLNDQYAGQRIQDLPAINAAFLSASAVNQASVEQDAAGRFVTVAPLFAVDQTSVRFYLYAIASNQAAHAKKRANVWLFLVSSLATLLLTSLVILIAFNHTVFKPLRQILRGVRWVEAGDLSTRLEKTFSRDELGDLARAFNTMVTQLQTDTTKREQAEQEIFLLSQMLEQRVAERTAELQAVNKELEAFSHSVSHDLRTPLRHISGFLDLLKARIAASLDDKSMHYMDTISDAAKRMGCLIDDLLDFSRMGRNDLAFAQVDMNLLLREVIPEFDSDTKGRRIEWHIGELPLATGDRAMLRIVWVNLISNALKFTQKREIAEISIGYLPESAAETVFFIRDNGAGFDTQYASKLFGVFQRLHGADEFEGTGIGLANVRRVITRHGGRTWAEGQVNVGATFFFSLPQAKPLSKFAK